MKNKICCIFNVAPHYNAPIYRLMDSELKCDFYLGDQLEYPIELMKYDSLKGYKKTLKNKSLFRNFYWQKGAITLSLKPYKYYILTGEPYCLSTWVILLLNRLTVKKSIVWTHGWYGNETGLKKIVKKLFFYLSNKILLYGDYAKNLMTEEGFNENKLICIYNSMDYDTQYKVRLKLKRTNVFVDKFNNNNPVLIYIGRIQKRKKLNFILEAISILKNEGLNLNFLVIGKDDEDTGLEKIISKYNLEENTWLYGPCYDEQEIGNLFYNSTVCVSPGNVGLTAIHSLMYGTPIITHNNFSKQMPEFESISEGKTGAFFKEDDIISLVNVIKNWIEKNTDNREDIRYEAYKIIDEKYNPYYQIKILKTLLTK